MPQFRTDEILWYQTGVWGELGYAAPNFGDDPTTLNGNIAELVSLMGRNLSAVMHHPDADLRVPPSINTLMRVHKLIVRARSMLAGRMVPPSKLRMERIHATPAPETFLIYPVPYFRVRNPYLKGWAGLVLAAISEACQHTENRLEDEISTDFAGLIGQYLQRIYVRMATELFQVPGADAEKPDFTLTEQVFKSYDPAKYFTSVELIDTVPRLEMIPTEDDLEVLTEGIPASLLLGLSHYPGGASVSKAVAATGTATPPVSASFVPPPQP